MQQKVGIKGDDMRRHNIRTVGAYIIQGERAKEMEFRQKEPPTTGSLTVARPGEEAHR